MSLEKDLQQKLPFKSDEQRGLVNIFFTAKYLESKLQTLHKSEGLTIKQFNILRILNGADRPLSTQTIRERMIDRMSDISRIVDRMVEKSVVSKQVNDTDKRLVDISLTDEGRDALKKVTKRIDAEAHVLGCLTTQETKELNRLLDKIRGHK